MKGFHVNWTKPAFSGSKHPFPQAEANKYVVDDLEILTTALSVRSWQKWFGTITLICDRVAEEYYQSLGLCELWDSIDTEILASIPKNIDAKTYWAAGKIWAQKHLPQPYAIIDTDAYFAEPLNIDFATADIVTAHCEVLSYQTEKHQYQNIAYAVDFDLSHEKLQDFIKTALPLNVSFLYINNPKLQQQYTNTAIELMQTMTVDRKHNTVNFSYMTFCEQYLLGSLVQQLNCKTKFCNNSRYVSTANEHEGACLTEKGSNVALPYALIWAEPDTPQIKPTRLREITPCHIGPMRHIWISKGLIRQDVLFRYLCFENILKDIQKIAPELLEMPAISQIVESYLEKIGQRNIYEEICLKYSDEKQHAN